MKNHLIDMFHFNMDANLKMIASIKDIPENGEMLKHLSHLATCQYKWLGRIIPIQEAESVDWWSPVYNVDDLVHHIRHSAQRWLDYLMSQSEFDLQQVIIYSRGAAGSAEVTVKDIALQLIFHSFHHRAQIQMLIRKKGNKPDFIEYIGSRINKKGES